MRLYVISLFAMFVSGATYSTEILETPNFLIKIEYNCPEGHVTCNNVTYIGTSKKSGKSIKLRGATMHSKCGDGATPCTFQGYEFKNGNITYMVLEDGTLQVVKTGNKVLVSEKGEWQE